MFYELDVMLGMEMLNTGEVTNLEESCKVRESFPFLELPSELRQEVYRLLFHRHRLFPDTTGSWKLLTCSHSLRVLEGPYPLDVSILQACHQIHKEAAPILYSENIFAFTTHATCKSCVYRPTNINLLDPVHPSGSQTNCGIQPMHTWLCLIGPTNRAMIREVQVMIHDPAYLYYDCEPKLYPDHRYWTLNKPAGEHLGNAFDLLSKKHSLRNLTIFLTGMQRASLNSHFFHNGTESMLFNQLVKITGPGLKFSTWPLPETKSHLELLVWLQVQMEMEARPKFQRDDARFASGLGPAMFVWKKRKANLAQLAQFNAQLASSSSIVEIEELFESGEAKVRSIGLMDDGLFQ